MMGVLDFGQNGMTLPANTMLFLLLVLQMKRLSVLEILVMLYVSILVLVT